MNRAKRLAAQLQDPLSPANDRLTGALGAQASQTALEHEMRREMASALGRANDRVKAALEALEAAGQDVDATTFNELRQAALDARLDLQIQREAMGIRMNDRLDLIYPVPPKR